MRYKLTPQEEKNFDNWCKEHPIKSALFITGFMLILFVFIPLLISSICKWLGIINSIKLGWLTIVIIILTILAIIGSYIEYTKGYKNV